MFELVVLAVTVLPYFGFLAITDYSKVKHRYEMSVTLPKASVIKKRLYEANFGDFVEKTHIDTQIANQHLYPSDVEQAVKINVTAYKNRTACNENCKGIPLWMATVGDEAQKITEIILQDNPAAIAKLKADQKLEVKTLVGPLLDLMENQ